MFYPMAQFTAKRGESQYGCRYFSDEWGGFDDSTGFGVPSNGRGQPPGYGSLAPSRRASNTMYCSLFKIRSSGECRFTVPRGGARSTQKCVRLQRRSGHRADRAANGVHTLGHTFIPPGIHAGGLRYHGMAPSVSALVEHGDIEARAVKQLATFQAAVQFSKAEGIIPAPESAHAIRAAIDEALVCKQTGEKKVIAFNLKGRRFTRHPGPGSGAHPARNGRVGAATASDRLRRCTGCSTQLHVILLRRFFPLSQRSHEFRLTSGWAYTLGTAELPRRAFMFANSTGE
jgi:hypothetical protein